MKVARNIYRSYISFNSEAFKKTLNDKLSGLESKSLREKISIFSPNTGKYGPEKTPYLDTFHAVTLTVNLKSEKAFLTLLTKQATLKAKFLRHNKNLFMTKQLQKTIMKRSQRKNRYNKNKNYEKIGIYVKNKGIFV